MGSGAQERWEGPGKTCTSDVSTLLALALGTKDVATERNHWLGGSLEGYFDREDSRVKQEPS